MPAVTVVDVIHANASQIFSFLSDMADFPRWMKNVIAVDILEKGDNFTISSWDTRLQGARFQWVERDEFFPDEGRIVFSQTRGDLKRFEGYWLVKPLPEIQTEVTLVTEFEFGIPMLQNLLNPIARVAIRENARAMIRSIAQAMNNEQTRRD